MIEIGAYKHGTNQRIDEAISMYEQIVSFFKTGYSREIQFSRNPKALESLFSVEELKGS